jgi:hypothetical protein
MNAGIQMLCSVLAPRIVSAERLRETIGRFDIAAQDSVLPIVEAVEITANIETNGRVKSVSSCDVGR